MKRYFKFIFIVLVFIVLILCGYFFINKRNYNYNNISDCEEYEQESEFNHIDSKIKKVSIRNDYYVVERSVRKFYYLITKENVDASDSNALSKEIFNLFDNEYIEYKNLTPENVLNTINIVNSSDINIKEMYVSQRSFDISIYFVYGKLRENGVNKDFSIMVKVDRTNETFKLYLEDYMKEKYPNIKVGNNIDFKNVSNIPAEGYNSYDYKIIDDDTYAQDLFFKIKSDIIYDNESLYKVLDKNFKKEFKNYQEFYDYISSNYLKLMGFSYSGYITEKDKKGNKIYTLKDGNQNFEFIINEKGPFDYTLVINKLK